MATPTTLYRYTDIDGTEHLVPSIAEVPPQLRSKAVPLSIAVETAPAPIFTMPKHLLPSATVLGWHLPSLAVGFVAAVVLQSRWLPGKSLLKAAVLLGMMALGSTLYLGAARQMSHGKNSRLLSSPKDVVDDAAAVRSLLEQRMQQQQEYLERLESAP